MAFRRVQQYKHVYKRLVLEECAAIMLNSKKGNRQGYNAVLLDATDGDDFTQVRMLLDPSQGPGNFAENDLLLLFGELVSVPFLSSRFKWKRKKKT
jgi:hypothetical protein